MLDIHEVRLTELTAPDIAAHNALHNTLIREIDQDARPESVSFTQRWLEAGDSLERRRILFARHGGRVVGRCRLSMETMVNQNAAEIELEVVPDLRRRGVATALFRAIIAIAASEGKSSLVAWGVRSPASCGFWDRMGMPEVARNSFNRLALASVDRSLVARWRDESRARSIGYEIHEWKGSCPDHLMDRHVQAQRALSDAPLDGLDMEYPDVNPEWNRAQEEARSNRADQTWAILALSPTGEPAAMTDVIVHSEHPWIITQLATATLGDHRNLGLGRWVKAAMIDRLVTDWPDGEVIQTFNANSNDAMLKLNADLGFRRFVELTTRQAALSDITAVLDTPA